MARQPLIQTFGKLRPTGADSSGAEVLNRLAGVAGQVSDIAFGIQARKSAKEGRIEGLKSGESGQPLELKDDSFSIRNQAFNEAAILSHRAAIQTDSKQRLDELQKEESLDPEKFATKAGAYKDGLLQGMPEELKFLVSKDIDSSIASRQNKLNNEFMKRANDENRAILNQGIESYTDDILNATREGDAQRVKDLSVQMEAVLNQGLANGVIDASKAESIRESLREQSANQRHLGEIDRVIFDENLTLEERVVKGEQFLNDLRKKPLKDLDPNQKDSLVNVINSKVNGLKAEAAREAAKVSIEDERRVSNLKVKAELGLEPPEKVIEETETLFNQGLITGDERASVLTKVAKQSQKQIEKAKDFVKVSQKLSGNHPEIVLDQKLVNDYYNEIEAPQFGGLPPEEAIAHKAQFISMVKSVPTAIKQEIQNAFLSDDPDLIKQSADLIDRIDEMAGVSELALTTQDRAFASRVVSLMPTMEHEEAVKQARLLTDPSNKALVESRQKQLDELKKGTFSKIDYLDKVNDMFDSFFDEGQINAITASNAAKEYRDTFEALYLANMDEDEALKKTEDLISRNWKDSQFGVMKYPLEDYYSVGGEADYIKPQFVNYVKQNTIGIEYDEYLLISDEQTGREAAQGRPSYRMIGVKDGMLNPIIIDVEGKPSNRYMPDAQEEQERQLKINQGKAEDIIKKATPKKDRFADTPFGVL